MIAGAVFIDPKRSELAKRVGIVQNIAMKTKQVPFDIYIPATTQKAAVKVDTILIEIYTDDFGNEMVTTESTKLIDKTQAHYISDALHSRPEFGERS